MQREIERIGIPTVGISIVRTISEKIKPPRTLFLKYPYGHPFGEPFNHQQHLQILKDCLRLFETATPPGVIEDSPYKWKRTKFN